MFSNAFKGKKVLVTGHTGFKGSWLSLWLLELGAEVYGFSVDIPSNPSMFETIGLDERIDHLFADVCDYGAVLERVANVQPDFIFHLAAQPIVSLSHRDPLSTLTTNAVGTANVMEACRHVPGEKVLLVVTSDKCYHNIEWEWGYRENDRLGGVDIYSASKAAAEIIFDAYHKSFFDADNSHCIVGSARAGNVIGGGDWARDRVVVDCVLSWQQGRPVIIRSPKSTRPWQHVLEPLSGYLSLAAALRMRKELNGESFNFGPKADQNRSVEELISDLSAHCSNVNTACPYEIIDSSSFNESGLLKLNCDKALFHLKWRPTLGYSQCISLVGDWYSAYYSQRIDMRELTLDQLKYYVSHAQQDRIAWAIN